MSQPFANWRRGGAARQVMLLGVLCAGCNGGDMREQPRFDVLEGSDFFADGRSARPLVEGTVARGQLMLDSHFDAGRVDGELVQTFPEPVTFAQLQRGRQRFNIFCTPCHGEVGLGDGMAVQRGYPRPPSLHSDRLREQPVGYFYDVITNGFGRMMDYREQIPPADRWAITAYIRALQLSQHAEADRLDADDLSALNAAQATESESQH